MTMPCRFSGWRALALTLPVLVLVATGCGEKDDSAELGGGAKGATTVPQFFPLTGLAVSDAATVGRPAATVKIENHPASRPQAGLDAADVVFEAVVEGGQTRFLAVFHSTDTDSAGPIRSVRPSDPAVVTPFGGIVAYSGGIPRFVEAMRATGLQNFDENATDVLRRRRDRAAPHNLYTSTEALYAKASDGSPPPPFAQFLKPGEAFAPPGATPVTHLSLNVGTTPVDYDWDPASGSWKRAVDGRPHTVESGTQLAPTTVIVQFVSYQATGEVDTTGAAVSEAQVTGSGEAVILAGGVMVPARWSKPSASAMTTWTDAAGAPISLVAGRTWVELPATGTPLATR